MSPAEYCDRCPLACPKDAAAAGKGFCRIDEGYYAALVCLHKGEEPVLSGEKGMCNIFFPHCNMRCIYCQNCQISRNDSPRKLHKTTLDGLEAKVASFIERGILRVGFVSPSHMIPQMTALIARLRSRGRTFYSVMNTNAFDREDAIESLEGMIDIYLPDLKYMDSDLSRRYSGCASYVEVAKRAVKAMFRQKGSSLSLDDKGLAVSGLIIRHLVLPGHIENTFRVLRFISDELSPDVHISLMSQYYPTPAVQGDPNLGRILSEDEYGKVVEEMERLGFSNGWVQDPVSHISFRPDFFSQNVFE